MAQERVDVAGRLGVDLLGQAAHGVERAEGIAVGHVLDALVGPLIALALELDDVVLAVARQPLTEYLSPVDLDQEKALGDVEGARKFIDLSARRQAAPLVVVELANDTLPPKVSAVGSDELANNVRAKSL